jgi:hypothetical protein
MLATKNAHTSKHKNIFDYKSVTLWEFVCPDEFDAGIKFNHVVFTGPRQGLPFNFFFVLCANTEIIADSLSPNIHRELILRTQK